MSTVTKTYEVWDGTGEMRLSTTDSNAAYQLAADLRADDVYAKVHSIYSWKCEKCGRTVTNYGGRDESCACGAQYNAFGQRLRDDWRDNPSNWDDDIGDMEGFEISQLRKERE